MCDKFFAFSKEFSIIFRGKSGNAVSSAYEKTAENLVIEAIAQMNTGDVGVYYAKKRP